MHFTENGIHKYNGSETHKSFPIHYGLRRKFWKRVFEHFYVALNMMKLTYVIHVYKSMLPTKNDIKSTNIMCTGSCKSFCDTLHFGENFEPYFNIFIFH